MIYLHGVHSSRLIDSPVFTRGVRATWTARDRADDRPQLVDGPDLPGVRRAAYGRAARAGQYRALDWRELGHQAAGNCASWAPAWAAKVRCGWPSSIPTFSRSWQRFRRPSIIRCDSRKGTKCCTRCIDDAEDVRQDTATLHVHPLNWPRNIWFCCDPIDHRWHESTERLRLEAGRLGNPARTRPGNQRRRPRHRVLQPHGGRRRSALSSSDSTKSACGCVERRSKGQRVKRVKETTCSTSTFRLLDSSTRYIDNSMSAPLNCPTYVRWWSAGSVFSADKQGTPV